MRDYVIIDSMMLLSEQLRPCPLCGEQDLCDYSIGIEPEEDSEAEYAVRTYCHTCLVWSNFLPGTLQ